MGDAAAARPEGTAPIYVLSFRQRDELAALATGAGWRVVAARRADDAERRFLASGARIALIDARGAVQDGLTAARALGDMIAATGNAMLVLVARGDDTALGDFVDAGATHFLAAPFGDGDLLQALRCAGRHVERVAGNRAAVPGAAPLGWRAAPGERTIEPSPALAALLGVGPAIGWRAALATIAATERRGAIGKIRRLAATGDVTAITHALPGLGRVVEHLRRAGDGGIEAMIEPVHDDEDAPALRDGPSARRWLDRRLSEGARPGVVLIALTRFDLVNAAHGRAAGDALLAAAAARIEHGARAAVGRRSIAARIGGSEFLVAADVPPDRTLLLAEGLAEQLGRGFSIGALATTVGCRIGVAQGRAGDDAAALLRRASEALAEAKASEGIIAVAGAEDGAAAPVEALAVDLRHALDRGEIELLFQPQVVVASGRIVGVEALARWRHPRLGPLGAETLFAAAERADLATALSDHVHRLALAEAGRWPARLSDLRLAVNVTAADIARPGFADLFLDRVDTSGIARERLTVEITESGLIDDLGSAASLLAALRGAGLRIAIDDFGTGYSSLAYLKALPLDYLKIDRRLSQDIAGSARDRVVVRGVIDMARSLGLTVIAEGVETAEQLDLLAKEGCQLYQGFLYAGPLTSEALAARAGESPGR